MTYCTAVNFWLNNIALYGSVEITCLLFTRLTMTGLKKNVETPITEETRPSFHEINNVYSNLCTLIIFVPRFQRIPFINFHHQ